MTPTAYPHRRRKASALITAILAIVTLASPAAAQPGSPSTPNEDGDPVLAKLKANLASAAAGYLKAEAELAASQAKQAELQKELAAAEADVARVKDRVADYAAEAYMTGRSEVRSIALMLEPGAGGGDVIKRAVAIDQLARADSTRLVKFADAKRRVAEAKAGIDAQVAIQDAAVKEMAKRKAAAEKALAEARAERAEPQYDSAGIPIARPAPRNPDGTWPSESCSEDDPTTSGCITPRTLHALKETKRVGFSWYVSCYRPGNRYEHPKGRACDWAAFRSGFVNSSATGANKTYGDRLAAFYVKNAKALGVMYVVWYCKVWQYGVGWHRYTATGSNCGDAPAGDHTNHVHLSVY